MFNGSTLNALFSSAPVFFERFSMRIDTRKFRLVLFSTVACLFLFAGCGQKTDSVQDSSAKTKQDTTADVDTENTQLRDGARVVVNVQTNPRGYGLIDGTGVHDESNPDAERDASEPVEKQHNITIGDINITVADGSTGIDSSPTATPTGNTSKADTNSQSVTASQDITARVAAELAAAFTPGGVVDQALSAVAADNGTSNLTSEQAAELRSLLNGAEVPERTLIEALQALPQLMADQTKAMENANNASNDNESNGGSNSSGG